MTTTFRSESDKAIYHQAINDCIQILLRRQTALLYPHTQEYSPFLTYEEKRGRVQEVTDAIKQISALAPDRK